ncbi:ATP-dependent zinc protease family protein [Pseudidiomarina andamanensis]|uniref:ATP-dependent zinc protease n=1 Tax=Pseudidiomarina andamanensis TaxID=1940690 RepID=A0AA92IMI4_9GAMM|nr:ATP-dependent zinc protease [Pseudidiomarina andamanensis]MDS0217671.1 ATP-dependent zinc protease [Pseudidiomarina andamanensis]QGT96661.1 ATP-dependent zinc protease [Pseudidiomarina andamanensis]
MQTLGWREWGSLPELGIDALKMKVDTGARTSCLHAFKLEPFEQDGENWLRIWLHPEQHSDREHVCEAKIHDQREVTDSGGHTELRYVILSTLNLGEFSQPIELTLTNRDTMKFRMLLGRQAMRGHFLVDPDKSYLLGQLGATA